MADRFPPYLLLPKTKTMTFRIMEPQNHGIPEPQKSQTHRINGHGIIEPQNHSTIELQDHGIV